MADLDPVVYPQCKVGFAPDTAVCLICKIPLVSDDESGETPAPVSLTDDLASLEGLRTAESE